MNPLPHQIGKVMLNLKFDSESTAIQLQNSFPIDFQTRFISTLDKVFSEITANGETILIDKIEVDLGNISMAEFDKSLKNHIRQSLGNLIPGGIKKPENTEIIRIPRSESPIEIFLFFLKNGHFPWWAEKYSVQQLENLIISGKAVFSQVSQENLRNVLSSSSARQRLILQLRPEFHKHLLTVLYPEIAGFVFQTLDENSRFLTQKEIPVEEIEKYWPALVWELIAQTDDEKSFKQSFHFQLSKYLFEKYELSVPETLIEWEVETKSGQLKVSSDQQKLDSPVGIEISKPEPETQTGQQTNEIIISNAGMIILWPYLEPFFRLLNLIGEKDFVSENHREKAVLLTQFLVTGETETEEQQLPLNKLLTGWPLHKPLQKSLELNPEETLSAEDFLKSIIQNWQVLKNTSIAGLRETFLQRPGILRIQPEMWRLKVERKTVDILRDSLPWPVNIIKLPWMEKILYTEW